MMSQPSAEDAQRDRPAMSAGYGISRAGDGMLPWSWVTERLEQARNYWICTTRPDGRPHAMPVWGLWLNGEVVFSTDPASRKGRNIAAKPEVVVHLESGDDVVIVDGIAEPLTDRVVLAAFADAYDAKYGIRLDTDDAAFGVYTVRPVTVQAWLEKDFPTTATRWRFRR